LPDPRHALRRLSVARPLSRAVTHLAVVGLVAASAGFGIAAASGSTLGTPADQPFFSLVGTAHAGGATVSRQPDMTLVLDPAAVDASTQLERSAANAAPSTIAIPTPLAQPVAPPPATPEPVAGARQGTGSIAAAAPVGTPQGRSGTLSWPVAGGSITQYFHAGHLAVDIAANSGNTVLAASGGTVTWAGWRNNGGGLVVQINHGNGMVTTYNHLGSVWVSPGQAVARGQGVGGVGCTGICTGPHVHFEVTVNGVVVNPMRYL
jgi:murein DD-endopeptidase MepM/ murein hydrolase activator NlpD